MITSILTYFETVFNILILIYIPKKEISCNKCDDFPIEDIERINKAVLSFSIIIIIIHCFFY